MKTKTDFSNLKFNWNFWANPWSGYGIAGFNWGTALNKLTKGGVSMEWEKRTENDDKDIWSALSKEQKKLLMKPFEKQRIGIIKSTPDLFKNIHNDYRIGFTMVENSQIGKGWVELCNQMDHIFVPNPQNAQAFKECGVKVPISRVRQGFNPKQYKYFDRPERKVFTFSLAGWLDTRKNWDDVVRAFTSEFDKKEPVRLLLKNSCPSFGYWQPNDDRIKIIDRIFTPEEMVKFYQITDCFMFTSRGEGSGLPAREAMATGCPCILTDYQGLAEVCDPRYNFPIKPVAIDYPDVRPEQPGFMARMDVAEIMYWMRYVYEHQSIAKEMGKKAARWMKRDWSWSSCAADMLSIIAKI